MITTLYAGLLTLLYILISMRVIQARRKHQISTGYGPNNEIRDIVSAHANFAAYVPIQIILLCLLEVSGHISLVFIHLTGVLIVLGRYLHYKAFNGKRMNFKYRVLSMQMTLIPLLAMGALAIYAYIKSVI